jgi:hypothetical protein
MHFLDLRFEDVNSRARQNFRRVNTSAVRAKSQRNKNPSLWPRIFISLT